MGDLKVIILAGGLGESLWPCSRKDKPKPFLALAGPDTLLQQTVKRARLLVSIEDIYVVTGKQYVGLVREQVPDLPQENILVEPVSRDTAPAIALAIAYLTANREIKPSLPAQAPAEPQAPGVPAQAPGTAPAPALASAPSPAPASDPVMVVLPVDHIIRDQAGFAESVRLAVDAARATGDLVAIGIKPTRPETNYGYIQLSPAEHKDHLYLTEAFIEKPDLGQALSFLKSGQHLWNTGIFAWRLGSMEKAIARYLPDLAQGMEQVRQAIGTLELEPALEESFSSLPNTSIEEGILQKADNVWAIAAQFAWDKLDSWTAVARSLSPDHKGNVTQGRCIPISTCDSLIWSDNPNKLVVTFGLDEALVVDTASALLVADKRRCRDMNKVTEEIAKRGWQRFLDGDIPAGNKSEAGRASAKGAAAGRA